MDSITLSVGKYMNTNRPVWMVIHSNANMSNWWDYVGDWFL